MTRSLFSAATMRRVDHVRHQVLAKQDRVALDDAAADRARRIGLAGAHAIEHLGHRTAVVAVPATRPQSRCHGPRSRRADRDPPSGATRRCSASRPPATGRDDPARRSRDAQHWVRAANTGACSRFVPRLASQLPARRGSSATSMPSRPPGCASTPRLAHGSREFPSRSISRRRSAPQSASRRAPTRGHRQESASRYSPLSVDSRVCPKASLQSSPWRWLRRLSWRTTSEHARHCGNARRSHGVGCDRSDRLHHADRAE